LLICTHTSSSGLKDTVDKFSTTVQSDTIVVAAFVTFCPTVLAISAATETGHSILDTGVPTKKTVDVESGNQTILMWRTPKLPEITVVTGRDAGADDHSRAFNRHLYRKISFSLAVHETPQSRTNRFYGNRAQPS